MHSDQHWIDNLQLKAHPEGGFYKETYRSHDAIPRSALHASFTGDRPVSTAIYFLLRSQDRSLFHRIKSDELWHFHFGHALSIYVLSDQGLEIKVLGPAIENGESLQVVVPAFSWFGAKVNQPNGYTLSSCIVAPGFDFQDFELAQRNVLLEHYPTHKNIIEMLTK